MDEATSEIGDFYPTAFSTDLNGKKQEWEAVVLIPFIEEVIYSLTYLNIYMLHTKNTTSGFG